MEVESMIKNAFLSLKKNIGKTILLFVIIVVITNLVIAGLSIQSATQKSMDQIRSSLGNDVTLSVDFRNKMKNREPGEAVSNETSLTTTMADDLKNLKYVENYNYQKSLLYYLLLLYIHLVLKLEFYQLYFLFVLYYKD